MNRSETVCKIGVEACRLLVGVVFIFSGVVKAIDPMGGAIKIDDYFSAFEMAALHPISVLLSFNLSAVEFTLGVCLLLGVYRRYSSFLTLAFMSFMTLLTLYLALFDPVSDCGCFGDALILTNWQTFFKNIVLLAASWVIYRGNRRMLPIYTYKVYWFVALFAYAFAVGFAYQNYNHLPMIDFRPYKVGANIPALIEVPEGTPEDEYHYSFIYEKDGVKKEFSLEDAPTEDSTWHFVESKTELLKREYVPEVEAFNFYNIIGEDVTDRVLHSPRPVFLLIAPKLEEADEGRVDEISNIYDYADDNKMDFFCVTGSDEESMIAWSDNTGAEYPFLLADDVLLKTIIRSNPGLVLLNEGTILAKWHYNDFPQEEALKQVVDDCLSGKGNSGKEELPLTTNVLTFSIPLLFVWLYDYWRNRRQKEKR